MNYLIIIFNYLMTHPQLIVSKHMLNLIFKGIKNQSSGQDFKEREIAGKNSSLICNKNLSHSDKYLSQ